MGETAEKTVARRPMEPSISTPSPARYRHWKLAADGEIATLTMDVDEKAACSTATS